LRLAAAGGGTVTVSIVVPARNEQDNVLPLYRAIRRALEGAAEDVEIVFVDDGSTDGTAARVRELRAGDRLVRLVRFSRNFGQQAALLAGLNAARGAAAITLDCDLQHPPELLPRMIEEWRRGARVVQMVRVSTAGASWFKRATSDAFYGLMRHISEFPLQKAAADYQLLDRSVVELVLKFGDRRPFLRGIVGWLGFPAVRIEYAAPGRNAGSPSYSVSRMCGLALDAVTGFSSKPLRLAYYLGLSAAAACLAYTIFAVVSFAAGRTLPGWTSVVVAITFLGAVQLVCLGIIGEYIARIYDQTRHVPPYVVLDEDEP
jgi:dolichol-phosphate mannosyltransferase